MANSRGPSSMRNMMYNEKPSLLPPKCPFPSISPAYVDYIPNFVLGQKSIPKPRGGNSHHQRTSSESCLIEEQPSWLDDLLNEPETPVLAGGHRRSSSDSFAYIDTTNPQKLGYVAKSDIRSKNMGHPAWRLPEFDHYKDGGYALFCSGPNSLAKQKNRARDAGLNSFMQPRGYPSPKEKIQVQSSKSASSLQEADVPLSTGNEKQDPVDSGSNEPKGISERKESSHAKSSASETDTKRAKQQFAQRSRVRKLQYISELERNVQALQAEGSDMSAELEFINQQNLILSMENKALKQRLENLAQEQLIKCLEHEVLEREIRRLQALYQQQQEQQQQKPSSGLRRTSSRDLDQHFGSLSLKHKEPGAPLDALSGQLHI